MLSEARVIFQAIGPSLSRRSACPLLFYSASLAVHRASTSRNQTRRYTKMSTNALPQTLQSITATKIKELSKQRALFEDRKAAILNSANRAPTRVDRVRTLLEGVTRLKGFPDDGLDTSDKDEETEDKYESEADLWARSGHRNIRRYLLQSKYDSSISEAKLAEWQEQLERELNLLTIKHDHALFFSRLVTDWLTNPNEPAAALEGDTQLDDSYQQVGREEMHEQRAQWESLVFGSFETDPAAIEQYLNKLFTQTRLTEQALKDLRKEVKKFSKELLSDQNAFTIESLKWVTRGVIQSDLFSPEKVRTLKEFLMNESVAQEVADVLNMRLAQLDTWSWGQEAVPLEMRRQLNGKYRVYMDEDVLDALFLQFIGIKWSVKFRQLLMNFFNSHAWKSNSKTIPKQDLERRQYYLYENPDSNERRYNSQGSVDQSRRSMFQQSYFMSQLPRSETETLQHYYTEEDEPGVKNAMDLKHSLLHLLITEARLTTVLHGQTTVVRSDFKWFGPSLPHTTLLTVLKFFDVPQIWLDFFQRFLEAPLKFVQDGPEAPIRTRKRGIPMSHAISDCLGEVLLFCMDFSVNQYADGAFLYRLHDDFWFWGQEQTCVKAWKAMAEFKTIMGIEFNEEKTGTVRLGNINKRKVRPWEQEASSKTSTDDEMSDDCSSLDPLPKGDVRWGFLKLDARAGRFLIDQEQVDMHIKELKRQLSACKSIFSWVQAWNSYLARFFSNNFGRPAMCFGRPHIEMVVSTLQRIEHELFMAPDGTSTNVTEYLRRVIAERFNVHDLPDGFFYFPVELGGLELRNPFIPFLAMREDMKITPERILEKAFISDEREYVSAKKKFEKHGPNAVNAGRSSAANALTAALNAKRREGSGSSGSDTNIDFMSLEEYSRYCESTSVELQLAYHKLQSLPKELPVDRTPELQRAQAKLAPSSASTSGGSTRRGQAASVISSDWQSMTPYWRWVAELYQGEMTEKYGGLAAVENGVVPLGVVKVLKEGKVKWQG